MNKSKKPMLFTFLALLILVNAILNIFGSIPLRNILNAYARGGTLKITPVTIIVIQPNSPASTAGFMVGDEIVSANGHSIHSFDELTQITHQNENRIITFVVYRKSREQVITVKPRIPTTPREGAIGIGTTEAKVVKQPLPQVILSTIVNSYAGYDNPSLPYFVSLGSFYSPTPTYDKSLGRLRELLYGMLGLACGIGLLKLKRWAFKGFVFFSVVTIVDTITTSVIKLVNVDLRLSLVHIYGIAALYWVVIIAVFTLTVQLYFIWYFYKNRGLFSK